MYLCLLQQLFFFVLRFQREFGVGQMNGRNIILIKKQNNFFCCSLSKMQD